MVDHAGAHRRRGCRAIAVIGIGVTAVVAAAAPALAHPVFANDKPGFPNPHGSTTSPYPGGSRPTLNMFLPFEQEGVVFNGAENTTVDVKVTIPVGWTSPACGAASTVASAGYRQLGAVVTAWTCAIETGSTYQVLHWHGPQVSPAQSFIDSAQFFTFQVTVPTPATQTSYGATGGPEGFYVEQVYADGFTSQWRTPISTRPGEVANGIVRTVAGTTAPPPNQSVAPEPTESHAGPNKPKPAPPPANSPAPKPTTSAAPRPNQGGGGPAPATAGEPSPAGTPAVGGPSRVLPESSVPASTDPSPEVDAQSASAKQLAQQRDEAAGRGVGWPVVVGIVLGAAVVAGVGIAVIRRRWRSS